MAEDVGDAFDGGGRGNLRQGGAHHFADDELAEIFSLQGEIQDLVFEDGADGFSFFEDGSCEISCCCMVCRAWKTV